ncbi:MAG: hydrogenase iron-sulfur subunit [Candidatus Bathyarchaeia archaeon]
MTSEKPKIVCFMCNWAFCQDEMHIPSNVNVTRVTCIGRVDPCAVLEAFEKGVDGVMLVGCKPPDCHFIEGNIQAERTVKALKKLLALAGIEPERIRLIWYSPLEEESFTYYMDEFCDGILKLGPTPVKAVKSENVMVNLLAAKRVASDFRIRVLLGREKELIESVNVYGEKILQEEFDALLDEIVREEFIRNKIYFLTKTKPLPVKALAEAVEMKPAAVLRHIVNMRRKNMIALDHVEGTTPFYKALEVG